MERTRGVTSFEVREGFDADVAGVGGRGGGAGKVAELTGIGGGCVKAHRLGDVLAAVMRGCGHWLGLRLTT